MTERLKLSDVEVVEIPWVEPVYTRDFPEIPEKPMLSASPASGPAWKSTACPMWWFTATGSISPIQGGSRAMTRFEESLTIVGLSGKPRLLVGLEGLYYAAIAKGVDAELYDEFSLQGQPGKGRSLAEIFADCGLAAGSKVGW